MYDYYALKYGSHEIVPYYIRGGRFLLLIIQNHGNLNFKINENISHYLLIKITEPKIKIKVIRNIHKIYKDIFSDWLQNEFVDNPWRENVQWIGDTSPQSYKMSSVSNDFS